MKAYNSSPALKKQVLAEARERYAINKPPEPTCRNMGWQLSWVRQNQLEEFVAERDYGIPRYLSYAANGLLYITQDPLWITKFLSTIRPGSDLEGVWLEFADWLRTEIEKHTLPEFRDSLSDLWEAEHNIDWAAGTVMSSSGSDIMKTAHVRKRSDERAGRHWNRRLKHKLIALLKTAPKTA